MSKQGSGVLCNSLFLFLCDESDGVRSLPICWYSVVELERYNNTTRYRTYLGSRYLRVERYFSEAKATLGGPGGK